MCVKGGKKKKTDEWIDDGRVIANMDLDSIPGTLNRPRSRRRADPFGETVHKPDPVELTKREKRSITRGVVLAYLVMGGGLVLLFTLILLFCTKVWLA